MRKPSKMNDTQLVLLSHATQRDDGAILPPPPSLTASEEVINKSLQLLMERNLIEERDIKPGDAIWRSDGDRDMGLYLTDAGLEAIGLGPDSNAVKPADGETPDRDVEIAGPPPTSKSPSKVSMVMDLMRRDGGASLDEIVAVTDWLPHSARAALTGLRKKGHAIEREKVDGVSRYRLTEAAH